MKIPRAIYALPALLLAYAVYLPLAVDDSWFAVDQKNNELLPATGSYFLAWGDANGDGWPDLWAGLHGDARLLLNRYGEFEDVSEAWGIIRDGDNHGAAWQDFDGDGDQDLIELLGGGRGISSGGGNRLYRNDGERFTEVAAQYRLLLPAMRGRAPLWLDVDHDQRVDLLLTAAGLGASGSQIFRQAAHTFKPASEAFAFTQTEAGEYAQLIYGPGRKLYLTVHSRDYPGDVFEVIPGHPLRAAVLPGVNVTDVRDSAWADLNGDLIDDLVVARSIAKPAFRLVDEHHLEVFMNKPPAVAEHILTFAATGPLTITLNPHAYMWWFRDNVLVGGRTVHELYPDTSADMDAALSFSIDQSTLTAAQHWQREGRALFIDYLGDRELWQIRMVGDGAQDANIEIESLAPISQVELRPEVKVDSQDPRLFLSGGGGYHRVPLVAGVENCGSVAAADFDNDGDVDLFLGCGTSLSNGPDVVLENIGGGQFVKRDESVFGTVTGGADSVAVADYNRDGALDIVVSNGLGKTPFNLGPLQFFHGVERTNNWFEVDLTPPQGQLFPVGAQLVLKTRGRQQSRTVGAGIHNGGAHDMVAHFGLGRAPVVEALELRLPDGQVFVRESLLPNQRYRFFQ